MATRSLRGDGDARARDHGDDATGHVDGDDAAESCTGRHRTCLWRRTSGTQALRVASRRIATLRKEAPR